MKEIQSASHRVVPEIEHLLKSSVSTNITDLGSHTVSVTHLDLDQKVGKCGCDTFGPEHIWSPDIWSPTIGPQLIGPSGQTVPNQFCPHGQMVPKNLVPMDKWSPKIWSPWTNGPQPIWSPNFKSSQLVFWTKRVF